MATKHMDIFSVLLVTREIQVRTQCGHILQSYNERGRDGNAEEDVGKLQPSYTAGENTKWCIHSESRLLTQLPYDQVYSRYAPKRRKTHVT